MFTLESNLDSAVFTDGKKRLRISFVTENIARVTLTEGKDFLTAQSAIVSAISRFSGCRLQEMADAFEVSTPALKLVVQKATGAIRYFDSAGNLLLQEPS